MRKDIKVKTKKTRRGRRKGAKNFRKHLRFLGVNAAGLRPKLFTFRKIISELKPSVFFVQETKYKDVGRIKLDNNYTIFELVRKSKAGGGLALGCDKSLHPVWVREGDDDVEALSVEISVKNMKIRCCAAYGCQENDLTEKKDAFWAYLDEEVFRANASGSGLVMHFDGNLWAGANIVPGDPRKQNRNGKLFEEFLLRNPQLTVVNSLPLCKGLITRRRLRDGKLEESILDFFVVCAKVLPYIISMEIDESKKYVLTNYEQARKGGKVSDTDHATEILDVDMDILVEKPERREIFNFKDRESQEKFKIDTTNTNEFTSCFATDLPLKDQIKNWRKVVNSFL